ncbi:hypothetical protein G7Y89_g4622 [Cudoniella acicularis]|uniref:Uncharacterized protein n=1 Tax=Cudoniella acicularis TaxID=354080 RepID=A0A8H4RQD2_9HELO|nr:hypothetical protein G7Y89_g4622 [Cudoniella acicularis]
MSAPRHETIAIYDIIYDSSLPNPWSMPDLSFISFIRISDFPSASQGNSKKLQKPLHYAAVNYKKYQATYLCNENAVTTSPGSIPRLACKDFVYISVNDNSVHWDGRTGFSFEFKLDKLDELGCPFLSLKLCQKGAEGKYEKVMMWAKKAPVEEHRVRPTGVMGEYIPKATNAEKRVLEAITR